MKPKNEITNTEPTRQPAAAAVPEWWPRRLTRGQVAAELETSIASVRRMEGGTLHPLKGEDGSWGFDPAEVVPRKPRDRVEAPRAKTSPEGELAAAVFRLFNENRGFREVVTELRLPPEVVRALYREWHEDGDLWIPRDIVGWMREVFAGWFPEERRLARIRTGRDLANLLELTFEYVDELHEAAAERRNRIKELKEVNGKLRAKLERLSAELVTAPSAPAGAPSPKSDQPASI